MNQQESNEILRQTVDFLSGVGSSSYAPFTRTIDRDVGVGGLEPMTAAIPALLPMTISTLSTSTGSDRRVEFTMLVNPENVNHGKTNSTYSAYTRGGWVTQLWGPNQDLLTGTGKSAAFVVEGSGLSNFLKRRSLGFQNFMALLKAYRNNGYLLEDITNVRQLTRVISVISGIEIFYDDQIFMGHFNNFTIDENAENPYIFNYNFEFVCSTLSSDYNEIRGHFKKMPPKDIKETTTEPVLMSDLITQQEQVGFFGSVSGFLGAD